MSEYRIVKITEGDKVTYSPERSYSPCGWGSIQPNNTYYDNIEDAKKEIENDKKLNKIIYMKEILPME